VRMKFERGELGYTWFDINGSRRSSDDSGPRLPKGSWHGSRLRIDPEANAVKPGYDLNWADRPGDLSILRMFHVKVVPAARLLDDKPQKRHAPKGERAIAVLKYLYPLADGRPSREDVPDPELEIAYNDECKRRGIDEKYRVKKSQLLRLAGRKDQEK
jgi:hypothetical protein